LDRTLFDALWVIVSAGLVLFMQAGFLGIETGLTRSKNSINVAVKNITDFGVATVLFWLFGFALAFGVTRGGLIGGSLFMPTFGANDVWTPTFFIFQLTFCGTAATIVSGAVAERFRFSSYVVTTVLVTGFLYPVAAHWAWGGAFLGDAGGWLSRVGFVDFAGSTVVHSVGGWMSLAVLIIIGPRLGRYGEDGSVREIHGNNLPMAMLGAIILWFSWIGFNGGSALGWNSSVPRIVANTVLAGGAGLVAASVSSRLRSGYMEPTAPLNGSLTGLVAITAGCHVVGPGGAVAIGAIAATGAYYGDLLLHRLRIDDAVGAIPVHLVGGIIGTLAVGVAGDLELLGTGLSRGQQIGVQALGIVSIGGLVFGGAYAVLTLVNRAYPLRVSEEDEVAGLNISEHRTSTELIDLYTGMERQRATGDIDTDLYVEPFTEVGQIAARYNAVLRMVRDTLRRLEAANLGLEDRVRERTRSIQSLLDVSEQGFFSFDRDLRIQPEYSRECERIFGGPIHGEDAADLLYGGTRDRTAFATAMKMVFDGSASLEVALKLFEPELQLGDRSLEVGYRRIDERRMMCSVRDVTESRRLQTRIEIEARERDILVAVVVHRRDFVTLLTDGESVLTALDTWRSADQIADPSDLLRYLHTFKANAGFLKLRDTASAAHELESVITDAVELGDFSQVSQAVQRLRSAYSDELEMVRRRLGDEWTSGDDTIAVPHRELAQMEQLLTERGVDGAILDRMRRLRMVDFRAMEARIAALAVDLAANRGKQIHPVVFEGNAEMDRTIAEIVSAAITHLVRNAVDHGIERPSERKRAGKTPVGRLRCTVTDLGEQFKLDIEDDGRGLDSRSIRARAIEQGKIGPNDELSQEGLVRLIFSQGFSTAPEVTETSGRGIGLQAIQTAIKEVGGRISLSSRAGSGTRFSLILPKLAPIEPTEAST
jgi:Amt family ammonium transporter